MKKAGYLSVVASSVMAAGIGSPAHAEPKPDMPWIAVAGSCPTPAYPRHAQREELTGTVQLSMLITPAGTVADSKVVRSSRYAELDKAAQDALTKCRLKQ